MPNVPRKLSSISFKNAVIDYWKYRIEHSEKVISTKWIFRKNFMTPTKRSMELQVGIFKASACFMSRLRANIAFMSRDMWNQFLLHCNLKFNKIFLSVTRYQRGNLDGVYKRRRVSTHGGDVEHSHSFLVWGKGDCLAVIELLLVTK